MKEKEVEYCRTKIAVNIAKLKLRVDKIDYSIRDPRATSGYSKICLQTKQEQLRREIENLELKYDQLCLPNFPICKFSAKSHKERVSLPPGIKIFWNNNWEIPELTKEVVEEIKWTPEVAENTSILDRVDEFIEQPVDEIIRQIRIETNTKQPVAISPVDKKETNNLWETDTTVANFDWGKHAELLNDTSRIDETVAEWENESKDTSTDTSLGSLHLTLLFPTEEMALTQAAVDTLTQVGQNNTDALVVGMRNLAAQRKLENIPNF